MLSSVVAFFVSWLDSDHNVVIHLSVGRDILLNARVVQAIAFGEDTEKGELKRGTGVGGSTPVHQRHRRGILEEA